MKRVERASASRAARKENLIGASAAGLFVVGFFGAGILYGIHNGWNEADHLHKTIPFCPEDGETHWGKSLDRNSKDGIALAQRLLAERGWNQTEMQDGPFVRGNGGSVYPYDVHYVTIRAYCPEAA